MPVLAGVSTVSGVSIDCRLCRQDQYEHVETFLEAASRAPCWIESVVAPRGTCGDNRKVLCQWWRRTDLSHKQVAKLAQQLEDELARPAMELSTTATIDPRPRIRNRQLSPVLTVDARARGKARRDRMRSRRVLL
jgi:hypothetical protein